MNFLKQHSVAIILMSILSLLIIVKNENLSDENIQNDEKIKNEKTFNNANLNYLSYDQRKILAREYFVKGRSKYDQKDYYESIKDLEFVVNSIPSPNGSSTKAKFFIALNYKQLGDINKFCSIMKSIQNLDTAAANWVKSSCESGSKVSYGEDWIEAWKESNK